MPIRYARSISPGRQQGLRPAPPKTVVREADSRLERARRFDAEESEKLVKDGIEKLVQRP